MMHLKVGDMRYTGKEKKLFKMKCKLLGKHIPQLLTWGMLVAN
jgi:hypothetical protein